jgi:hypothetical protein
VTRWQTLGPLVTGRTRLPQRMTCALLAAWYGLPATCEASRLRQLISHDCHDNLSQRKHTLQGRNLLKRRQLRWLLCMASQRSLPPFLMKKAATAPLVQDACTDQSCAACWLPIKHQCRTKDIMSFEKAQCAWPPTIAGSHRWMSTHSLISTGM